MKPEDIYVLSLSQQHDPKSRIYLRSPPSLKPSQCTPLFIAAFTKRNAGCCIHTHSQWAVLVTLLLERQPANTKIFEINNIEQIKGFGRGFGKTGNLGYHDTLRIPVIENTPFEEDLTESLEEAMNEYPDTCAVLVRRHGVYVCSIFLSLHQNNKYERTNQGSPRSGEKPSTKLRRNAKGQNNNPLVLIPNKPILMI